MEQGEEKAGSSTQSMDFAYMERTLQAKIRGRPSKNKTCSQCEVSFPKVRDLERHMNKRKNLSCKHCSKTFCNESHLGKHLRTISEPKINARNYLSSIHPKTGFEDDPKFQELLEEKKDHINEFEKRYTNHTVINKRIDSDFTYCDLDHLLKDIYCDDY